MTITPIDTSAAAAEAVAKRLDHVNYLACFGTWTPEKIERLETARDGAALIRAMSEELERLRKTVGLLAA